MVVDASSEKLLLIILILLIVIILAIAGWLINYMAGPSIKRKRKEKRSNVQFALEPSAEPSKPSPTAGDVKDRRPLPMGEREIMRVLRDTDTGAIIVEIEGSRYRRLMEIEDGRIGNMLLEAIADLITFTGGIVKGQWASASSTPVVPTRVRFPQPQVVEPAPPPQAATAEPPGSGEEEEAFLSRLREGDFQIGKTSSEEARPSLMGFLRRRKPQEAAEPTGGGGSFIDEIEAILQRMISTAPTPPSEAVHVGTGPDGGLQIQVGVRYFSSADEVPDPAIRNLIKTAVREWERS